MGTQTRLFVGNLPDHTSEKDLLAAFSIYGNIHNIDLKSKPAEESKKAFAFITLSCDPRNVESCVKHFSVNKFNGNQLYVTKARESFLERLERERLQAQEAKTQKKNTQTQLPRQNPVIQLSEKLNPRKRKIDLQASNFISNKESYSPEEKSHELENRKLNLIFTKSDVSEKSEFDPKKLKADVKRLESLKKKRQEFKQKQTIIKSGLGGVDKVQNKKIIFSDDEYSSEQKTYSNNTENKKQVKEPVNHKNKKKVLFEQDDSGDEIKFDIREQFEGKKGKKVLDLQSRYQSDKRFVLDERFIEDESHNETEVESVEDHENAVELGVEDEKSKQLNILQDVLGVAIKRPHQDTASNKNVKSKLGMLRFDPSQPEHVKFLAPVVEKVETVKQLKKKKNKKEEETAPPPQPEPPRPEVSKEQFYKVSETLKEAIAEPTTFSLRSLFGNNQEESKQDETEQDTGFIPIQSTTDRKKKVRNPLEPGEKNPFVYDSSDSEDEKEQEAKPEALPEAVDVKAVWKENLFFTDSDNRLKEGLAFFNKNEQNEVQKERRELKFLMKKRIVNKERKNNKQMFQKKIGGRKKTLKKKYRQNT